ncbi:hypothetical protein BJX99DRAFT_261842 [Aspergillus californicus]
MSYSTTAARSLATATTLFAGPGRASNSTPSVNGSATFHFVLEDNIQTLSAQNAPKDGPIEGLLFVPGLNGNYKCNNTTAPYIPANVTRHHDVASFGYQTIGLAPWVVPDCSQSFLEASKWVGIDALLFFLPSSVESKPPPADDSTWLLNGRDSWKNENEYPVYAIPSSAGSLLMEQLSIYSGNGTIQGQSNGSTDGWDIRLFTLIDLEKGGRKSPSIWGFVLAIIGTILFLCGVLLLLYQLIQKRRREDLQRRIEGSGMDFEQYGFQNIRVPQDFLARLPVYIYPYSDGIGKDDPRQRIQSGNDFEVEQTRAEKEAEAGPITQIANRSSMGSEDTPGARSTKTAGIRCTSRPYSSDSPSVTTLGFNISDPNHTNRLSHSQTTCAICLDDFIPASSTVRELPCGHIYHPDCIDVSLTRSSSLCPLCKRSVMPPDFYSIPVPEATYQVGNMREP